MVEITRIPVGAETLAEAGWKVEENDVRVFVADPLGMEGFLPHLVLSVAEDSYFLTTVFEETFEVAIPLGAVPAAAASVEEFLSAFGFEDVTAA